MGQKERKRNEGGKGGDKRIERWGTKERGGEYRSDGEGRENTLCEKKGNGEGQRDIHIGCYTLHVSDS